MMRRRVGKARGVPRSWAVGLALGVFALAALVGLGVPAVARAAAVSYTSYSITTGRQAAYGSPPNGVASTDGCYFVLALQFPGAVAVTDADALTASLNFDGSGGVEGIGTPTYAINPSNADELDMTVPITFLPGGVIDITGTNAGDALNGITVGGSSDVTWTEIHTMVPTGLEFYTSSVTVGSPTTPASTTITVTQSALVRSMNAIAWLSNGSSILPLPSGDLGNMQTTAAHAHMFWDMTTTDMAASIQSNAVSTLAAYGYNVTQSNNTVTITDTVPRPGEVLDIGNYDDNFLQANDLALSDAVSDLSWPNVATDISAPETAYTGSAVTPAISFGTSGESYDNTTTPAATYANNTAANNTTTGINNLATATVTLSNNCTYTVPFIIYNTTGGMTADLDNYGGMLAIPDFTFSGSAITPDVNAYDYSPSSGLTAGTDYVAEYYNNSAAATSSAPLAPTVEIVGIGNYYGSTMSTFTIAAKSLASSDVVVSCPSAVEYTGTHVRPVTVKDTGTGATLTSGTDYTITYANNVEVGKAVYVIDGLGNYAGELSGSFRIANGIEAATVTLPYATAVYNGKAFAPSADVKLGATTLTAATDYTLSYAHNRDVGLATVTVSGIGAYTGTATATFVIVPAKAVLLSVTPAVKKAVVAWKASAGGVGGYQVAYAGKAGGTYHIAGTTTARAKTVRGLKSGTVCFFKVRAFVKVGGTTYYGAWSATKRAKIG